MVRRDPQQYGHERSRWTLGSILKACSWLRLQTLGGLSQLLKRLGIVFKRGRSYVHSPDPNYEAKVAYIEACRQQVVLDPEHRVLVYLDEFTYSRQPEVEREYEQQGRHQALARRSYRANTQWRGIGALNALTGQVTYRQFSKIKLPKLAEFYQVLCDDYPEAEVIYVVQDNWPVHIHPDIVARFIPQTSPFMLALPTDWPDKPRPSVPLSNLPIQMLFLPTYASWLNPIEKLWRKLRQDVLHLHRLADDWDTLKQRVLTFMTQFERGSLDLLRYVGLLPD